MRLLARIGLLLLAAVFIAAFLFGLFRFINELGVSPLRYVLEDLLIAVAGASGFAACLLKSRKLAKQQRAEFDAVVFTENRFEANVRRGPMLLAGLLLLIAFGALGLSLAQDPIDTGKIALSGSFVLLMLLLMSMLLLQRRSGRPSLVMDSFALDHFLYGPIRWDHIQGAHLREVHIRGTKLHSLHLLVSSPGRYLANAPWLQRLFLTQARREAAIGEIVLPIQNLDQPPASVNKAFLALRSRTSPPLLEGWMPGASPETIKLLRETRDSLERMEAIVRALETGAVTAEQFNREIEPVTAELERQNRQRAPLIEAASAKARRAGWISTIITVALVLYFLLRIGSTLAGGGDP